MNPIKGIRTVGGITGKGAKNVNPIYKHIESRAKKQAALFAVHVAGTTAWIGSEIYKAAKREKRKSK